MAKRTTNKVIPVESLEKSDLNERLEDDKKDDAKFQELKRSIEALGDVNDPPLVRPLDGGGYEVIKGSRRVAAAKEAKGVDDIRCEVNLIDDGEALLRTITDNIGAFKKDVSPRERALSLYQLWDEMGDTKNPSVTGLSNLLGVSTSAIEEWLEPLDDVWEDTVINPLSDDVHVSAERKEVRNLSPKKLRSIRKTTGGGEDGIHLADLTVEHGLTIQDLAQVRRHVEDGASIENAVGVVTGDLSLTEVEGEADESDDESEELESGAEESGDRPSQPQTTESADTTDSPDSPQTSSADLGQASSFSNSASNGGTTTETDAETAQPDSPSLDTEDESDKVDDSLPERYQGRDLVASPEQIEKMQETSSFADTLQSVEEDTENEVDPQVEVSFTVYGDEARAALRAIEEEQVADDPADLAHFALTRFLREGRFFE